jgi:hypothetical protein
MDAEQFPAALTEKNDTTGNEVRGDRMRASTSRHYTISALYLSYEQLKLVRLVPKAVPRIAVFLRA